MTALSFPHDVSISDAAVASRILVIDDDPDVLPLIEAMLRPIGVRVDGVTNAALGLSSLRREPVQAVLLDHDLPDAHAPSVLHEMRADQCLRHIPVIVVTGNSESDTALACLSAGAVDYLRKPILASELRSRLRTVLEQERIRRELERATEEDALTGLTNRSYLLARLQEAVERRRTLGREFALIFADLDRFSQVNDRLGADAGDLMLRAIGRRLVDRFSRLGTTALWDGAVTVSRVGGDEFAVLLEGTQVEGIGAIADEFQTIVSEPPELSGAPRLTASIGVVGGTADYDAAFEVLRDAEIAMSRAKRSGTGRRSHFVPAMRKAVHHRARLEHALREAIGTEQIHLVYQPIVSLIDGQMESVEALVRWTHPDHGTVLPSEFIPLAEETRLIGALSDQILGLACDQLVSWQQRRDGLSPSRVNVNLSRVQLSDRTLPSRTRRIITSRGLSPDRIQFEVTESHVIEQHELALDLLTDLKATGIRLAIDDFGTGYSSLACIEEYPFDVLKLDRSLVGQIHRTRGFSALLRSVFSLAEQLSLDVVAEGIERFDQQAFLREAGCRFGQGYLLGRPMRADDLMNWLAGRPVLTVTE